MRTRFAVATVAVMLAVAPACRSNNNPPREIGNKATIVEPLARDVMGADDQGHKVLTAPQKPDVTEHRAEVMTTTPAPVKKDLKVVPKIKILGPSEDKIEVVPHPSPIKGSR